jgi:hypothetical protein
MARSDGVSARTKRGLVQSGALTAEDVGGTSPVKTAPAAAAPTRGIGKQITQAEYNKQLAAGKAKADANRQRMIDERAKQKLRGY